MKAITPKESEMDIIYLRVHNIVKIKKLRARMVTENRKLKNYFAIKSVAKNLIHIFER